MSIKKLSILSISILGLVACNGGSSGGGGDNGSPSLSISGANNVVVGNNTSVTVTLKNASNLTSPINVAVTSSNSAVLTKTPADQPCLLSESDSTCEISFYAASAGGANVSASSSGLNNATKSITVAINPSPAPDPININFVSTGLTAFLATSSLIDIEIDPQVQAVLGDNLYVTGSNVSNSYVLQYNTSTKVWTNVSSGFNGNSTSTGFSVTDNGVLVAYNSTGVYKFTNGSWVQATGGIPGYNIVSAGDGYIDDNVNYVLASNNGGSVVVYNYDDVSNTLDYIMPVTVDVQTPELVTGLNSSGYVVIGIDRSNNLVYRINTTGLLVRGLTDVDNFSIVSFFVNGLFVISAHVDGTDDNDFYVCNSDGCKLLRFPDELNVADINAFSSMILSGGKVTYPSTNTLIAEAFDADTGSIQFYTCDFNASGDVSSCAVLGGVIEPFINSSDATYPGFYAMINKFNNTYTSYGMANSTYYSEVMPDYYNIYRLSQSISTPVWSQINPDYNSSSFIKKGYNTFVQSLCVMSDNNNQSFLSVSDLSNYRETNYISYSGSWHQLDSPNSEIVYSNQVTSGKTINMNVKGFASFFGNEMKYAAYPVNCSQTFN